MTDREEGGGRHLVGRKGRTVVSTLGRLRTPPARTKRNPSARRFSFLVTQSLIERSPSESSMPTYVVLYKFTDQGRRTLKESPKRVRQISAAVQKMGGKVSHVLYTTGRYDMVVITEAPNDETALAAGAAVTMAGNVVAETLHAYSIEEFEKALSKVP
jgi:uncharacterized protein with GYD domain